MEKYLIADFSKKENDDLGIRKFFEDPRNTQWAREPVIAKMKNGTLICTFLTGGDMEPDKLNIILYKKSYDGGKTWTDAEVLFKHDCYAAWATEICTEFENTVMAITLYDGNSPMRGFQTYFSTTYDCGESWTEPVMTSSTYANASVRRGVTLSSGEVIFPIYYILADGKFNWDGIKERTNMKPFWVGTHYECAAIITNGLGESFIRSNDVKCGIRSLWEPNVIELEKGHIIMLIREERAGYLGISESFDMGRTFNEYKLSEIPNPGTKVTLFKIEDTICIINNFVNEKRTNLELRTTKDFKTFDKIIPMDDPDKVYCYPHVAIDQKNRLVYISYENYKQHLLNVLTFDEILSN